MRNTIPGFPDHVIDSITAAVYRNGTLLTQEIHRVKGRAIVALRIRPGKYIKKEVHKLMALTFLGAAPTTPPSDGGRWEVSHKDNNKLNNTLSNLEWASQKKNQANSKGVKRKTSKPMSDTKLRRMRKDRAKGMTILALAAKYDKHPTYVSALVNYKARPNA